MTEWLGSAVVVHHFADNSGTVFFHLYSGETLALSLPLVVIARQLPDANSELRQNPLVMQRLKLFLSETALNSLSTADDI
ncbi:hypothetical protein [Rheinheimera sp. 4Y26]|uniref:hypothetical protein n=1 Tax=Rheinheimera sp. 4Y26 TaxID=2977811 RepID=UPI0021B126FF|nr:hypothetical protein [Rheinheimera sp. 4Y26]MCT6699458.1 hypothetical protein [Rheinheimera sp. 4Y26]